MTIIIVLLFGILLVWSLINYLDKSYQEVFTFFESVNDEEFLENYGQDPKDSEDHILSAEFRRVVQKLNDLRKAKDENYQYLKTIVQHVGIGLITFNREGDVQIMNTTAKRLLKTPHITNINALREISEPLVNIFFSLKTGGRDLIRLEIAGETIQLSVYVIELTLQGEEFKLISLQNIQSELEEKEMEAWQKLVRVLTHEIMNSVTPISSLASTVESELVEHMDNVKNCHGLDNDDLDDIHQAVQTIQKRSEGLIRFVTDFRSLTHVPTPKKKAVAVQQIFEHVSILLKNDLEDNHVHFSCKIKPEDLIINIDPELIQQVLINLVKNAIQAFTDIEHKVIALTAGLDEKKRVIVKIKDNGQGIEEEALSKIFIPFYTTKKSGSGIGLSLSKQIIRQHGANISVKSEIDIGTEFTIRF